ncbi:hypothetical protein FA15DRAFT_675007 [Coprinopsis marcescibilis]|uniref:Histone chaperone domain-containing protein n=1 Tax=Coprinopsis marcescibilis TaxID=230819 RepID=A0A5C3KFJ0_COPMA|nr:hypothetical protein FA15DRAFT_675007 [Coprinopsis marcescibilis]
MSSSATDQAQAENAAVDAVASPANKGKGKATETADVSMEEEEGEDEEEEEDDEDAEEEEEEDEEDQFEEIDPSAILPPGRRTRGVRVDYTSKEALARAGFTGNEMDEDDEEDMKE